MKRNDGINKLRKKIELWKQAQRGAPVPPKQVHRTKVEKQAARERRRKDWNNED